MDLLQSLGSVTPSVTKMIRMDHTHAMLTAHRYQPQLSPSRKHSIVEAVCTALEVHAQLEEEIFYPALRNAGIEHEALSSAGPEHDEMRQLIGQLRNMQPEDALYDERFMQLMRTVLHHVADEETILLPLAEQRLASRLGELGARMTRRRLQLVAPVAAPMAWHSVRAMPVESMVAAAALCTFGALVALALRPGR